MAGLRYTGAVVAAAALAVAGCGGGAGTVTGEVTYDGSPVRTGYVTFAPADGKGQMAGAEIKDGKYRAENVPVGPKVVKVEASEGPAVSIQTTADLERFSKENKGKIGPDGIVRTETVPADADGNNQPYEVKAGEQELKLTLKKPAGKK